MLRSIPFFLIFLPSTLLSAQNLSPFDADAKKAHQLIETGQFGEAKRLTDRLMQQASSVAEAWELSNLATAFQDNHRFMETEPLFKQALEIYEKILGKDDPNTAILLNDLGVLYEEQARYTEAEPFHRRALEIRKIQLGKDHPDTIQSLNYLAILYRHQGRYAEAEPLYTEALRSVGDSDEFVLAVVQNNFGLLYQEQYHYDKAEHHYKQALAIFEKMFGKDDPHVAPPLHNLARLYRDQGRYTEAEPLQLRALAIDEKHSGKDHPDTAISLNGLAMIYHLQGRHRESEQIYKRCLEILKNRLGNNHPKTADSINDLAELFLTQGRYAEAEPLFSQAIAVFEQSTIEAHVGQRWYNNRATVYKSTQRPEDAIADLKRAMDLSLEVRKHASGGDEQRAHAFSRYYSLFERMVDWQYEFGNKTEAYEAMERSRAQGLQDIINGNNIDLLAGMPVEIARKLRTEEAVALAEIASAERSNQIESLKIARQKLINARAAIRSASPAYRMMIGEDRKPVALDTILRELVAEKTLAMQYLIGSEKSYLLLYGFETEPELLPLVLDEKQAELFGIRAGTLTTKKLDTILQNENGDGVLQSIADPRKVTGDKPDVKTLDKLALLWAVLVPDDLVRRRLKDGSTFSKLLILPDGALARFPFEAMVVETDATNPTYLLDCGPVTVYAPSASMYYNLKHRRSEFARLAILTVGNPDYSLNHSVAVADFFRDMHNTRRAARMGRLSPLKWTEKETEMIETSSQKNGISVIRLNLAESTEANVRKNVSGQKIVHLACHGLAEDDIGQSLFGTLALTIGNPNDPKDDGFLELAEMFELDLKSCELAVLSACDTNLGPNQRGEGTWSMGRGMLASGAKRVVTTNWQVADDASADLVADFIGIVNSASSPDYGSALRTAKQTIRRGDANPGWRHPYFWAPFVLIGPN